MTLQSVQKQTESDATRQEGEERIQVPIISYLKKLFEIRTSRVTSSVLARIVLVSRGSAALFVC